MQSHARYVLFSLGLIFNRLVTMAIGDGCNKMPSVRVHHVSGRFKDKVSALIAKGRFPEICCSDS